MTSSKLILIPPKTLTLPKPRPRAVGRRGGTSSRVAWHRHLTMDRALWERVERDKT